MGREPPLLLPRAPARTGATNMGPGGPVAREPSGEQGLNRPPAVFRRRRTPSPIFRWGRALGPAGARATASPIFGG